jgi:hypothetical protein
MRRAVILLGAIFILAAQHPNLPPNTRQNAAAHAVSNGAQNVSQADEDKVERAHRARYEAECHPADDKRDSDLCAQWKAADAAADSAWWAARSTWVSGISGLLVLIALGFAFEANRIARRSAHWQLRPYVYLEKCIINPERRRPEEKHGVDRAPLTFYFKNFGQTPAKSVTLKAQWSFRGHFNEPFDTDFSKAVEVQLGDMPPAFVKDYTGYYVLGWAKNLATVAFGGMDTLFVEGILSYLDANGEPYETVFRLGATGEDYQNQKWSVPPHGNRAT